MKKVFLTALALLVLFCACACAQDQVNVFALKGPTGIGMVGMMENNADNYAFTLAGSPDEIVAAMASGSADIAACPTNLAAVLNQKTNGKVQLLALNTLGVLHVISNDTSITSFADLAGHKIYATGQGGVPEYALNYILAVNGLTDQVEVEYVGEHSELATMMSAGQVELGILPEPHVTSVLKKNADMHTVIDVTEAFNAAAAQNGQADTVLSMGCVAVRREFAEAHPDQVATFLDQYATSVEMVNADPTAAGALVEKHGVMPSAAVATSAIPRCHIVFIEGEAMRAQVEPLYALLFAANPKSIGGAMPDDAFYYVR